MTKRIEKVINQVQGFVGKNENQFQNEVTEKAFNQLIVQLREDNKFTVEAQIEVGWIEEETLDIGDLQYIEDYEVLTSDGFKDDDGNEFATEEEAKQFKTRELEDVVEVDRDFTVYDVDGYSAWDTFDSFGEAVSYVERNEFRFEDDGVTIKPLFFVKEDDEIVMSDEGYEYESEAEDALEEYINNRVDAYIDELEPGKLDEVMWNTVWSYNGKSIIDHDIAKKCGLAVVRMMDSGCEYLAFTGCGMDLSPQLIAYQALSFGYIDENNIHHFTSKSKRDYFQNVVGTKVYTSVLHVLGIYEAVKHQEEKA